MLVFRGGRATSRCRFALRTALVAPLLLLSTGDAFAQFVQQPYPQQGQSPQPQAPSQPQASYPYPQEAYPQASPPQRPAQDDEDSKRNWLESFGLFALRGSTAGVNGGDASGRTNAIGVWMAGSNYGAIGDIGRTRSTIFGGLAGGSGFEGALGGSVAIGARVPLGKEHGPLARIGVEGHMVGNDLFYHSGIQFPQLQLAYQFLAKGAVLEIGVKGAPVLDGRLNVGNEASRRLGASFGYAGYATYQEGPVILDFDVTRVAAQHGPGTPVDAFTFDACLAFGLAICFDARFLTGDVQFGVPTQTNEASVAYLGLSIGFGGLNTKVKK